MNQLSIFEHFPSVTNVKLCGFSSPNSSQMFFRLNRASEHEKKLEELAEEERRKRRLAAEVQQEDREWEEALEEYKDFIRPGELDGLLKLPGQK